MKIACRLFRERRAIDHAGTHTHLEMSRRAKNCLPNKQQIARLDYFYFFTSLTEERKIQINDVLILKLPL